MILLSSMGLAENWACLILWGIAIAICVVFPGAYFCSYIIKMKRMLILIGIAILSFGCIVYLASPDYAGENWVPRTLAAANSSLSAFFPSRGGFESSFFASGRCCDGGNVSCMLRTAYWVFHVLVFFYVATIIVSVFGVNFCNKIWLKRRLSRKNRKKLNVFWSLGAESEFVAADIAAREGHLIESSDDVVFIVYDKKKSWLGLRDDEHVHAVARKRWRWIFGDVKNAGKLSKADRHFFLGQDGQNNVAAAEQLIVQLPKVSEGSRRISIYVRISAAADDDVLYRWADEWNRRNDGVEIVVVREESLVARRLLLKHPMWKCPGISIAEDKPVVSGAFRVLVLGFGAQGKTLMNEMICDAQYVGPDGRHPVPIFVDVFDRNPLSFGWFKENCADACRNYTIEFHRRNVKSAEFWKEIKLRITKDCHYNRVVICTRDDRTNISVANDIVRLYREASVPSKGIVFARVRNEEVNRYLSTVLEAEGQNAPFSSFGRIRDTYSSDVIVTDNWDRGAMWLNWKWSGQDEVGREELWKSTPSFNRQSSRASFFGQRNLLRLMGYEIDDKTTEISYGKACLTDMKLEILAMTEHLRWMAFLFVRGVKAWDAADKTQWPVQKTGVCTRLKANRIADINAHAALVDFEKLPEVDERLWDNNGKTGMKGNLQQIDRDFVLTIVPAMKEAGFGIKAIDRNDKEKQNGISSAVDRNG